MLKGVPLTGLTSLRGVTDPAINREAIIRCPYGTKTAQLQNASARPNLHSAMFLADASGYEPSADAGEILRIN